MDKKCTQVKGVVDTTTGEILSIIQSDIKDLTMVIVKDVNSRQFRVPVANLICSSCKLPIEPGDGFSLFLCQAALLKEYRR